MVDINFLPCPQFPVAQDALIRPRFPRRLLSLDHLVDRAAYACDPEVCHGERMIAHRDRKGSNNRGDGVWRMSANARPIVDRHGSVRPMRNSRALYVAHRHND